MKRFVLLLISVSLLTAQTTAEKKGYTGWAIGGGLSLAVPQNGAGVIYANQHAGPGIELSSIVRFDLGAGGELQYAPSVSWWGRWDNWGNEAQGTNVSLTDWELNFNITDMRYVPPVPDHIAVRPYVGFGLLGFSVYYYKEDVGPNNTDWASGWYDRFGFYHSGAYYNSDTDFAPIQNFYVGAEFELDGNVYPYVEFKVSNGNVHDFQSTIGFTVQHKK